MVIISFLLTLAFPQEVYVAVCYQQQPDVFVR